MKRHLLFLLLLVLVTTPFVLVGFLAYPSQTKEMNSVYAYLYHEGSFIARHGAAFVIWFVVLTLVSIRYKAHSTHVAWYKRSSTATVHVALISVFGFILSYGILLGIAVIALNVLSLVVRINPKIAGVITNQEVIAKTLVTRNSPPQLITSGSEEKSVLITVAAASAGENTFYGDYILSAIPSNLIIPTKNLSSSLLLLGNTVIVDKINPHDIQVVSPAIGYQLVKQYFPQRNIKSYPKVTIMNEREYINYRKADTKEKIKRIDKNLQKIETAMATLDESAQKAKDTIAYNRDQIKHVSVQRDKLYDDCISAGSYKAGIFYRTYSPQQCKNLRNQGNESIKQGNEDIKEWDQQIELIQNKRAEYKFYQQFLEKQKEIVQASTDKISRELGVFEPGDSITISFNTILKNAGSAHPTSAATDYFVTLAHEYLHYASYVSDDRRLYSAFFEEGLTEYFARKIIQNSLHVDTNLGYPIQAKIIHEMMRLITEREFADIYFTKDEAELKNTLDRVYGPDFYTSTLLLFEQLHYTSDPKQAVKLANEVMAKIGGDPVTEKDLESSPQ